MPTETKTTLGAFVLDQSNLWHYDFCQGAGTVFQAAEDALAGRPTGGACWFWFNGTPAPIFNNDERATLLSRWDEWRTTYQDNPKGLVDKLRALSKP